MQMPSGPDIFCHVPIYWKRCRKPRRNYLFDSKVLALIADENEIENLARKNIDGVIFQKVIK